MLTILCIYYRVKADMFGWYGNSDIRDNNGELPSHTLPPPVEYITFDEYLMQHDNIIRYSDITNLTYNVTLLVPSDPTPTDPTASPQPLCINTTIFYVVVSILAAFSFVLLVALIAFLCHRSRHKVKQPK